MVFRLESEAYLGVSADHRAGDISGYRNGCNPECTTKASGSLSLLPSQISISMGTPLYPSVMIRSQRSSEALLIVTVECYIDGVSNREGSKLINLI